MAGRYRKVDTRIWNDAKFRALSDGAKLVFLFLLTHPSMTSIGAMRATIAGLASELQWATEDFGLVFVEALEKGIAEVDERASYVGLPNFVRYNLPESPNVVKSWGKILDLLPECASLDGQLRRVVSEVSVLGKAFQEALPKAFLEASAKPSLKTSGRPTLIPSSNSNSIKTLGGATRNLRIQGIKAEEIQDNEKLMAWLAVNAPRAGLDPNQHPLQREIFSAAEESLRPGRTPGFFRNHFDQIAAGKSPSITAESEESGKRRYDAWRRGREAGNGPNAIALDLANKLSCNDVSLIEGTRP